MAKATAKTKNAPVPAKTKGTAVAVPDDMLKMMESDSGKGVSTAMDDNVVPLIYILQALSKPCIKKTPEYVEGAEPGMIWFRGTKKVVEEITAQPVFFSKCVIEWRPDRGGFVARHNVDNPNEIEGAKQIVHPKDPKKTKWVSADGNDLVPTREHVVLVHGVFDKPTPFVIPMSGSQHTASRNWMGLMNQKQVPGTDRTAPSYAYLYKMTLEARTNGKDNWFGWEITDAGEDGEAMMVSDINAYKLARKINDDFSRGALRADNVDEDAGAGAGESGDI